MLEPLPFPIDTPVDIESGRVIELNWGVETNGLPTDDNRPNKIYAYGGRKILKEKAFVSPHRFKIAVDPLDIVLHFKMEQRSGPGYGTHHVLLQLHTFVSGNQTLGQILETDFFISVNEERSYTIGGSYDANIIVKSNGFLRYYEMLP